MKKLILFCSMIFLLSSCFGDKKSAIGTNFDDSGFVNKNFKGNKIEFTNISTPCNYTSKEALAKLYNTTEDKVFLIGGNEESKGCTIRIQMSDEKFDYITGMIHFYEEPNKNSDGSDWIQNWQLQKGISKSAVWISNLGKAAMYKENKRELLVRFDNYNMSVIAPGSAFNKSEKSRNRDYKKIAMSMAKNTSLF